ncbi:MAG: imelysin family protein [Pseudomonadota bacterium]
MRYRPLLSLAVALLTAPAWADLDAAIDTHTLPRMDAFAAATARLAEAECDAMDHPFREAALAWAAAGHLTLGPVEEAGRGRAILFWPDGRDATGRGLRLLAGQDPAAWTPDALTRASVAARGLGALGRAIFEDAAPCPLTRALAADLAASAAALRAGWDGFADTLRTAGAPGNTRYLAPEEAQAAFLTALASGLEHTAEQRLGRPLGSFDDPRPLRAELRRSDLSLPIIIAALESLQDLAGTLADAPRTDAALDRALSQARAIDSPDLSAVADPAARARIEALQTTVRAAHRAALQEIGAGLGIVPGFNSADGD